MAKELKKYIYGMAIAADCYLAALVRVRMSHENNPQIVTHTHTYTHTLTHTHKHDTHTHTHTQAHTRA